ncbi:TauD/TfdA dioxygenase family protein [Nocardia aurea]|uniref:TauD/TfdA dioxygenase family protein n=1 Tax=Nocardia aurea TaxID=2144174 RepID=UPI0033B81C04
MTIAATEQISTESTITVAPQSGYTGAEISGVDLSEELSDQVIAEIRQALLKWKVVFFRDQTIGHAEQIAFARRFGKVTPAHPYEENPPEGFPEILPIDSRRYGTQYGRKRTSYDSSWHTDVTALINPPAFSILRADILPPYGGDTAWTNLVAAYENLPAEVRAFADVLDAEHTFENRATQGSARAAVIDGKPLRTFHPVVRVHPETGERALFVSPGFTRKTKTVRNLGPRLSSHLLDALWEEATRTEYTVRFRWAPGSVAFWDNRATAHLAIPDAGHLGYDRVLYRVTIEGDVPQGVDARLSESLEGEAFLGA